VQTIAGLRPILMALTNDWAVWYSESQQESKLVWSTKQLYHSCHHYHRYSLIHTTWLGTYYQTNYRSHW